MSVVSCQLSVVSGKNQDFQSNHWQFLVVSYFRHPALHAMGRFWSLDFRLTAAGESVGTGKL
ncbi:hypothetical protein [Argonema antarcticum]|uniref:hypothetical protein n=1 Tax=Argonema antarcticum TaxID=2942763 RepID=UPI0020122C28|nr:hypothetical protein [Argonema antarcticum]MCL1475251.1 hypothetical protein [Argonema antarcticum A004/B2]